MDIAGAYYSTFKMNSYQLQHQPHSNECVVAHKSLSCLYIDIGLVSKSTNWGDIEANVIFDGGHLELQDGCHSNIYDNVING